MNQLIHTYLIPLTIVAALVDAQRAPPHPPESTIVPVGRFCSCVSVVVAGRAPAAACQSDHTILIALTTARHKCGYEPRRPDQRNSIIVPRSSGRVRSPLAAFRLPLDNQ